MVSVSDFEKAAKTCPVENVCKIFNAEDKCIEIQLYRYIKKEKVDMFISDIVNAAFDENGNHDMAAQYFEEKKATMKYFTNVKLPQDDEKIYSLLYGSNIYWIIRNSLPEQWHEAMSCVDDIISARMRRSKLDGLIDAFTASMNTLGNEDVLAELSNLIDGMKNISADDFALKVLK